MLDSLTRLMRVTVFMPGRFGQQPHARLMRLAVFAPGDVEFLWSGWWGVGAALELCDAVRSCETRGFTVTGQASPLSW